MQQVSSTYLWEIIWRIVIITGPVKREVDRESDCGREFLVEERCIFTT